MSSCPLKCLILMVASVVKSPTMIRVTLLCGRAFSERALWRLLKGVRLPREKKGADLWRGPGNFWASPRNFWGSLGQFCGTSGLLLISAVREVAGKSLGNFWEVGGNCSKSREFPEAPGKSDSLSVTRQNCHQFPLICVNFP